MREVRGYGSLGEAVQVDPINPTLKAHGTKRLKLKCDKPLSNFAFNFNFRRYTSVPPPAGAERWRR
jgi:hypothetical protein